MSAMATGAVAGHNILNTTPPEDRDRLQQKCC